MYLKVTPKRKMTPWELKKFYKKTLGHCPAQWHRRPSVTVEHSKFVEVCSWLATHSPHYFELRKINMLK